MTSLASLASVVMSCAGPLLVERRWWKNPLSRVGHTHTKTEEHTWPCCISPKSTRSREAPGEIAVALPRTRRPRSGRTCHVDRGERGDRSRGEVDPIWECNMDEWLHMAAEIL